MSIRTERTSTVNLLRDGTYHYAALLSDPATKDLAGAPKKAIDKLRKQRDASELADEAAIVAGAVLDRCEFELDLLLRRSELEVLGAVDKKREALDYRAVLPNGFMALVNLTGAEQAREALDYQAALAKTFPEISKKYGKALSSGAEALDSAETAWKEAVSEQARANADEVMARAELTRTLRKSEATLMGMFPGDRARVRSYFRKTRRSEAPEEPTP